MRFIFKLILFPLHLIWWIISLVLTFVLSSIVILFLAVIALGGFSIALLAIPGSIIGGLILAIIALMLVPLFIPAVAAWVLAKTAIKKH